MPMTSRSFSPADPDPVPLQAVPEVARAHDDLLAANQRWRDARDRYVTARDVAEKAPQADASAAILAVAEGSKLPPVTAGKAQAQADEAHRILDASEGLAVQAEQELLDAVATHRDALTQAQQARVESALDRVDDALNALAAAMNEAGMELARLINVNDEQYGNPLTTSMPMRWDIYDGRVDATVDARGWIDAIRDYAHQSRPTVKRENEQQADAEWQATIAGDNERYQSVRMRS